MPPPVYSQDLVETITAPEEQYFDDTQQEELDDDTNDSDCSFNSSTRDESLVGKKKRFKKKLQLLIDQFLEQEPKNMSLRSGSSIGYLFIKL